MATRTISNAGGNWNATATWVEGVIPTSADDVVATATSGPLTMSSTGSARSLDFTGYTSTFTSNAQLTLGTSTAKADLVILKLSSTMTLAGTSTMIIAGTYVADFLTVDTAGKTISFPLTFGSGSGNGKWKFVSSFTSTPGNGLGHSNGILDFNNQNVSINQVNSTGALPRTLNMGTGTVSINALTLSGSGLTFTAPPVITLASWLSVSHAGIVFQDLNFTSAGARYASGTFTCAKLTRIGTSAHDDQMLLGTGVITVTGTLTLTDNSGTGLWVGAGSGTANPKTGAPATIALGTTGTVSLSGVDFSDVIFTGTNTPVSGMRLGDGLGNTGVLFDAARTLYWIGGVGNWSDSAHWSLTSGGTGGQPCPRPHDDVVFDNGSFTANSQTATGNYNRMGRNVTINVTNRTSCQFGGNNTHIFGSLTSNTNTASSTTITFRGRGSHTIGMVSPATNLSSGINVDALTGTYTLTSDLITNNVSTLVSGTYRLGGFLHRNSLGAFIADSGTQTRALDLGTGTLYVQQSSISFGTSASGFTLSGSGTVQGPNNGTYTFKTNGQIVPNMLMTTLSTGNWQLFDNLTVSGAIAHTGGVIDLNGKTVSCSSYTSSGSLARTLTMGAANLTVNGNLTFSGSNLTFTPGTSTVTVNGQTGNTVVAGNGLTFNNLALAPKADAGSRMTVDPPGLTAATFTVSANNAVHGSVVLNGNVTTTTSFTATGQAGNPVYIYGPDWGGQAAVASPTPTLNDVTFNRINATGGSWTGTGVTFVDNAWKQGVVIAG